MILSVREVSFAYQGRAVLDEIDLDVAGGELTAVLGPNGVGKTTLLKTVNGIHRPGSGAVFVDGLDVTAMAPSDMAARIGYVAQKHEPAHLTVFDAVLMGRTPHIRWRVGQNDLRMVESCLRRLELDHLCLRHLDELSGGELQKVAVARALVQEPRLLLLDEPTSSLDMKNQVAILRLVRRVVDEHKIAAVMTMHDLNTALRFAHRFVFLKDGRIHAAGRVEEITCDMVREVYGLPVTLHTIAGRPMIVPEEEPPCRVH